jgi:ribosome-binding protein aMBF1 (putative translation factor)
MKLLSYNGRGLQKATAVTALVNIQKRHEADVIFLMETHLDEWPAECLRRRLYMKYKEVVKSDGRKGGLLLLWKKEVVLSLRHKTQNYIDVFIGVGQENIWRFTGFYGEPRWEDKYMSWIRLRELKEVTSMPWLVMGDLNEVLYSFEKEGGRPRPNQFLIAFQEALADCGLTDLGYSGDKFTWHRGGIRECLDRAIACDAWRSKFADATVENLDYSRSDHRPILLKFGDNPVREDRVPSVLRFEARWLKEKNFHDIVQEAWNSSGQSNQSDLATRLSVVHKSLHRWNRSVLKKPIRKIKSLKKDFEELTRSELTEENIQKEKELAKEIEQLLEQEEIHWAQRSRINWLQFGDKNTNFFHNFATSRRQRNRIKKLKDDHGNLLEGTEQLNPLISDYFAGLFTTEVDEPDPELIEKVTPRVTEEINTELLKPFTAEEVKKALFSIGDMKAPGRTVFMLYSSKNVGIFSVLA